MTESERTAFLEVVWRYYAAHGRYDLPWRRSKTDGSFDPYEILVSEIMLQQTQVTRVITKFSQFLERFPTVETLATAPLAAVLQTWQGLGYNRRAKYLWLAARRIMDSGWPKNLTELPGVGVNTAGALNAYIYNKPVVFIETNIRTVYIHHFARESEVVADGFIRECLEETLDREEPRDFYWALMDYGSYLKTKTRNLRQSKHYRRQSTFQGSRRQLRGLVIRELSTGSRSEAELAAVAWDERLGSVLQDLVREGLVCRTQELFRLTDV